jgi:hypothetical protein
MQKLLVLLVGAGALVQDTPDLLQSWPREKASRPAPSSLATLSSPEDQTTAFTPHKIVGNVYYVVTKPLVCVSSSGRRVTF